MRKQAWLGGVVAVALLATACGDRGKSDSKSTTTGAKTSTTAAGPAPAATEIGVSATEIRVAVLADVDNPIIPGLFAGARDAVVAFEGYVNDNGGIAGRKLKVDFIDTGLSPDKVKTALQEACANDFALVGTSLALAQSFEPMIQCKDKAGAVTGLPDFAAISVDPSQQNSPVTFAGLPPERNYGVTTGQEFTSRTGVYSYLKDKGLISHGLFLNSGDSQTSKDGNSPRFYAAQNVVGIKDDGGGQLVSQFAKQSDFLPFAQTMKDKKSDFAETGATYQGLIKLVKAAKQIGVTGVTYVCVLTCYDKGVIDAASDLNGLYVTTPFVPFFDEKVQAAVPAAKAFVDSVGADKANGFGVQAWIAALLFQRSVEDAVKASDVNGLTRKSLLAAVANVHDFDAGGLIGPTDVAARRPNNCETILQLDAGAFKQLVPTEPGKLDCKDGNVTTFTHDVWAK